MAGGAEAGPPRPAARSRRLFVAVWLPQEVAAAVAALDRPAHASVRWTRPETWHVTLRFLGGVAPDAVPGVVDALQRLRSVAAGTARLGPVTRRLGRSVLVVPVAGLEDVATALDEALATAGVAPEAPSFTGHLTLARARGRAALPRGLAGTPVTGRWTVEEVTLVESTLHGARGSEYAVVARVPLGGAAGAGGA